jgi:hypothetical protein
VGEVTQSHVQWVRPVLVILVPQPAQEPSAVVVSEVAVEVVAFEVGSVVVIETEAASAVTEATEVVSGVGMAEEVLVIKMVTVLELPMVLPLALEVLEEDLTGVVVADTKTVIGTAEAAAAAAVAAAIVSQSANEMEVEVTGTEIGMVGIQEMTTGKDLMMETATRIHDKRGATRLMSRLSVLLYLLSNHQSANLLRPSCNPAFLQLHTEHRINCFSCVTILSSFKVS